MLHRLAEFGRESTWLRWAVLSARRLHADAVDRALNIRTVPRTLSPRAGLDVAVDAYPYEPMDYRLAHRFLRTLEPRSSDVVYDLGCGMGRLVCLAARMNVRSCVGVEISPAFAGIARDNAARLKGRRCPIAIIEDDAADIDYSDGTIFLLFNPFGEQTLRHVLDRIEISQHDHPREIRIGYGNPMHEDLLESSGWLERYRTDSSPFHERPTTFWRSMPCVAALADGDDDARGSRNAVTIKTLRPAYT